MLFTVITIIFVFIIEVSSLAFHHSIIIFSGDIMSIGNRFSKLGHLFVQLLIMSSDFVHYY